MANLFEDLSNYVDKYGSYKYEETTDDCIFTITLPKNKKEVETDKYKDTTILLDPGHGGMIDGVYQTAGKRSPDTWGPVYYEGVGNRDIVKRIMKGFDECGINYINLVPEETDVPLDERTARANTFAKSLSSTIYQSVHSNGGGGTGFSVYTYIGQTSSDTYATVLYEEFQKEFPEERIRTDYSDGDPDKEANFWVLKHTAMPSLLSENFFMDTKADYELLMTETGRQRIADCHIAAYKRILKIK